MLTKLLKHDLRGTGRIMVPVWVGSTALAALAVRSAPFGKRLFAAAALLPMTLHLAASFSRDSVLLGLCFAFTALVLDAVCGDGPLPRRELLLLAGMGLFFLAQPLLSLLGAPQEAAAFGARVLRWQSPVLAAQGVVVLANMLTQSLGCTVRAALIATSRQGLFFIPLLLTLPRLLGETGLVLCQSASDVLSLLLTVLLLRGTLTGSACARCGCSDAPTACR